MKAGRILRKLPWG